MNKSQILSANSFRGKMVPVRAPQQWATGWTRLQQRRHSPCLPSRTEIVLPDGTQMQNRLFHCLPCSVACKSSFLAKSAFTPKDDKIGGRHTSQFVQSGMKVDRAGVKLFIGSKVQCVFCSEICSPEERGGEQGGKSNFTTKHTLPSYQERPWAL